MEKIRCGIEMSRKWTDPPIVITVTCVSFALFTLYAIISLFWLNFIPAGILVALGLWYRLWYLGTETADVEKYITFNDDGLRKAWAKRKIPINTLYESYILGKLDFKMDVLESLQRRNEFISFRLTFSQILWLIQQLFPQTSSSFHTTSADRAEIRKHYDRGNDFFAGFMGPSMVYTSSVFHSLEETPCLEIGQKNKMDRVCKKLQLKPGHRFLDIGCGWGTLARHGAKYFGAKSTGVTLSKEGKAWCDEKNEEEKLTDKVEILHCHYREIPHAQKFDRVSSIEMAEHVGITHFQEYLGAIRELLDEQGMFLMQVSGLRKGADWHDVQWGLFMSKYIFPGADASTPLAWYVRQLEQAGFEVNSVETIGKHYSYTLLAWYKNWLKNKNELSQKYGDWVSRLWVFFLAWSVIASGTGSATCYQLLCHKNTNEFDRNVFIGKVLPIQ